MFKLSKRPTGVLKKILVLLSMIFVAGVPLAYAHPIILDSNPAQSGTVSAGSTRVAIYFSEEVEIEFSIIKVLDGNGNQIDNKDTQYLNDEKSLVVTTPPLQDGIYTVTTKVLSKVDGHLVDYAFVFGVGDVVVPPPEQESITESIYFPEAGARFPGLIGQTIVLGAAISTLVMWGPLRRKNLVRAEFADLAKTFQSKFFAISGIGLFLVFASNILMLVIQTVRLQTSASAVLQTSFGEIWIIRMAITVILLAVWFLLESKSGVSLRKQAIVTGLSLALIGTTTIIGHGAASEQSAAIAIDYVHNLLASVWIGGVIFFGFILVPSFASLGNSKRELAALVMIPRFSSMILIALGVLIITGPTLLWLLEDDVGLLSQSYYGYLIIAKILIGSAMIALGGYNQSRIQAPGEKAVKAGNVQVYKKIKRSLKAEAALGIALLGVVALLTNSSLPTGQTQDAVAGSAPYGFATSVFSENGRFDISIEPFTSGQNSISVSAHDLSGDVMDDVEVLKVKISNPQKGISPIEVPITKSDNTYTGEATFGFSGSWNVEILTQRSQHANEDTGFTVFVKPRISQLNTKIVEYGIPAQGAAPLYPAYDGDDTIWISDASKARLWKFSISQQQFTSYEFDGKTTVFLKIDGGKIWFTDTPESKIGYFDPKTEQFTLIALPEKSIPISLESDLDGNMWIALVDKHSLLKYDPRDGEFEEHKTPTVPSGPVALSRDSAGNIWFAESQGGRIGMVEPGSGRIQEFMPAEALKEPFALFIDADQNVWISEHTGLSVIKFNPVLQTFDGFRVTDPNALPFGLASDKFENIWIAQHTTDKLGVYDPHSGEFGEIDIPTTSTFTQFVTADKNGDIWFVEQRGNKLGHVEISESLHVGAPTQPEFALRYSELAAPFIAAGIVAASLFLVKSVYDKRRLDALIE